MRTTMSGVLLLTAALAWAGPNENALVSMDMDPASFGSTEVQDTVYSSVEEETFTVYVVVDQVDNLDTYTFSLAFDTTKVAFQSIAGDDGVRDNVLTTRGGSTCCWMEDYRDGAFDTVFVGYTLQYADTAEAPEGFGLIAAVEFSSKLAVPGDAVDIALLSATLLDSEGEGDNIAALSSGTYVYMPSYTLTVDASVGGSTTPSGALSVTHGDSTDVAVSSIDEGCEFSNWQTTAGTAYIKDPDAAATKVVLSEGDAAVEAVFVLKTYTLNVGNDGHGTTSPSGDVSVTHGDSVEISVSTVEEGYEFDEWVVTGGAQVGDPGASTTKAGLTADGTVQATFVLKTYTLNVGNDGHGTTSPSGDVSVTHGDSVEISVSTVEEGYEFDQWVVTGGAQVGDPGASTTKAGLTADGTVRATFTTAQYTLNVSTEGGYGSTSPDGDTTVTHGDPVPITATPGVDSFFVEWTVLGGSVTFGDPYASSTSMVLEDGDAQIQARFEAGGDLTVTITSGAGDEEVYLYAASGWVGRIDPDGDKSWSALKPGTYLAAVKGAERRLEYAAVEVTSGGSASLTVDMRQNVPNVVETPAGITSGGSPIHTAGALNSAVMEDFDRDGDTDLLLGKDNGDFDYYAWDQTASDYVVAGGPEDAAGSPLSVGGGIVCLRTVDWNADNVADLAVLDGNGDILLLENVSSTGGMTYDNAEVLLSTGVAATGFDLADLNADALPDVVIGLADGSVRVAWADASFAWNSPVWDMPAVDLVLADDATPVSVGADAAPAVTEMTGDGEADLLVGSGAGVVHLFRNRGNGTYQARGPANARGDTLEVSGSAALSIKYGPTGDFPTVLLSDDGGYVWSAGVLLQGDFDLDDVVGVTDLQRFGDAWGAREDDGHWRTECNLDLRPDAAGEQAIDIYDLGRFGDSWSKEK